jgi:hypothetical protein
MPPKGKGKGKKGGKKGAKKGEDVSDKDLAEILKAQKTALETKYSTRFLRCCSLRDYREKIRKN